jgi:serine/threonine protein kinase
MILNEIEALRKCQHIAIVKLYEVYQEMDRVILILELVRGIEFYQYLKESTKVTEK